MKFLIFSIFLTFLNCSSSKKPFYEEKKVYWIYKGCHVFLDTLAIEKVGANLFTNDKENIFFKSYNPENNQELLIANVYIGCEKDTPNFSKYLLKNMLDVPTFKYLGSSYYLDKSNFFYFFMNSDGGQLWLLERLDKQTPRIFPKSHFAIHQNKVYYMGQHIELADSQNFEPIYKITNKDTLFTFFGRDKKYYFNGHDTCSKQEATSN